MHQDRTGVWPPDMDIGSPDAFDRYLDYLFQLLSGAETLFINSHYHLSAFAAITAIEETSRAHISAFRKKEAERKKGRDPLRNHLEKQKAAVSLVFMGGRMHQIFGSEEEAELFHSAINDGYLNELREKSLYCFDEDGIFVRPIDYVNIDIARTVLLVAIETVDDTFCGTTNHSFTVSRNFDAMFERVRVKKS
jgi:AbiV family abortive infection protein